MKHIEYDYQVAVFQWAEYHYGRYPALEFMFATMNESGVRITPQAGLRNKKQGKKSGVPDICLPVPCGTFHGLWVEMKSPTGKVSKNQEKYLNT